MVEENSTMITKVIFSENKAHRYLLTKQWNEKLPSVAVIMLQAGKSNALIQDVTTCNIINCVIQLDNKYGGVVTGKYFWRNFGK